MTTDPLEVDVLPPGWHVWTQRSARRDRAGAEVVRWAYTVDAPGRPRHVSGYRYRSSPTAYRAGRAHALGAARAQGA